MNYFHLMITNRNICLNMHKYALLYFSSIHLDDFKGLSILKFHVFNNGGTCFGAMALII